MHTAAVPLVVASIAISLGERTARTTVEEVHERTCDIC